MNDAREGGRMSYARELKARSEQLDAEILKHETRIRAFLDDAATKRMNHSGSLGLKRLIRIRVEAYEAIQKTEKLIALRRTIRRVEKLEAEERA